MSEKTNFDKGLYFIPLGGSEQFGMNLNAYICDGDLFVVDCGIGFADDYHPGIDILVPDPSFIDKHHHRLKGLVITHAHEDHIGAVARLWDAFECPVYGTEFTLAVLKKKFEEENIRKAKMHIVDPLGEIQIGAFKVQFIPVTHSVPGTVSLLIDTAYGQILHSGDWNLDPRPVVGEKTDSKPFTKAGDKGVLAYIGDSTNAGVSGVSGSESDVRVGLEKEFKKAKGKIAVTMFSSNISRVQSIAQAAEACGRRVAVIGRSLHRMIGCAFECGYLKDCPDFIDESEISNYPSDQIVLIVTGSQGEYRAALAKIARGAFKGISLGQGDTVLFSARAIPGNERGVNQVKNNLSAAGVNIVTPRDTDNIIHVSGHPCQDEIAQMLQWVRPQTLIPVHGERMQLDDHAAFAKACQVKQTVVPTNGAVIQLAPKQPKIVDHVETGLLAVDERRIIPSDHDSINQRRKLQYSGAVHISFAIDGKGKIMGKPQMQTIGLVDEQDSEDMDLIDDAQAHLMKLIKDINKNDLKNNANIHEAISNKMRRFFNVHLGIKPIVNVHVLQV